MARDIPLTAGNRGLHATADDAHDAEKVAGWLAARHGCVVLTGAGVSTESGIPDYRDRQGQWKRKAPVQFREFVQDAAVRRRYWARSLIGWPLFAEARPSAAHRAFVELEARGYIQQIITQNVDGLHQRAGSARVIDLHGRLDQVICLDCGQRLGRDVFQRQLAVLNPGWLGYTAGMAPDGDADLEAADFDAFRIPECQHCGGLLKPEVVFFGESVPRERGQRALALVLSAGALLVAGSSLMVWSGFRLVRAAAERGIPVVAINRGHTRADALLAFKCDTECGALLAEVVRRLATGG